MAKRLWCVLLTAVMLLNLLPVGMAEELETESAEPAEAAMELQQEVQEVIEEPLPPEETLPEEEAAEEPIPYEAEPQPEEEAMEEPSPSPVETELAEETDGPIAILTIPEEELLNEELPDMLMAAAPKQEDKELVEEEEADTEEGRWRAFTPEELAKLGIQTGETVYKLDESVKRIPTGTYSFDHDVKNDYEAYISGSVKIILPREITLTFQRGLRVTPGNSLTIEQASGGSGVGRMNCFGPENCAGIGGRKNEDCGNIYIMGGLIRVRGGRYAAGIGGGKGGSGGYVEIRSSGESPDLKAYGGQYGAGIGGGDGGSGGKTKLITGGTVEAYGGEGGAGIGGGRYGYASENPSTPLLILNAGNLIIGGGEGAAGIGGGFGKPGGPVTLNAGRITVDGGEGGAAVGGGNVADAENVRPDDRVGILGPVIINDAFLEAAGGKNAAAIGGGKGGGCGKNGDINVRLNEGCEVVATGGDNAVAIGCGSGGIGCGSGGSGCYVAINAGSVSARGGLNAAAIGGSSGSSDIHVTINGGVITARGGENGAGIGGGIGGDGIHVTITGGFVEAIGGKHGAGIGGNYQCSGADVKISGGKVRAYGGLGGAGIGGGLREEGSGRHADGGTADISGGTVTARGGQYGAGIGSGSHGDGGVYTIRGGTVEAYGGQYGAGIGGGDRVRSGKLTVNNGEVTAIGGEAASGIGGGRGGDGWFLFVHGGTVTAKGGENGAGIGGGDGGSSSTLVVSGGVITATGGAGARAIGRGRSPGIRPTRMPLELSGGVHVLDLTDEKLPIQILAPTEQEMDSPMKAIIGRVIGTPAAAELTYNGRRQIGYLNPMQHTRVEGTTAATNAGNYKFTVVPEPGYTWIDYTTGPKTVNWSIERLKATVKANDQTMTYGEREPVLTARVTGTINRDRLNYQLTREPGKAAGDYKITPSGEQIQNAYDVTYETGTLTIRKKNVSENRRPESLTLPEGSGDFREPVFHDRTLDEDIPGTLTYTYDGRDMTKEEISKVLAGLKAGTRGTILWRYEAKENFTGTIRGSINFRIASTAHVHRFAYIGEGNQIMVVCRQPGCTLPGSRLRLTLNAPANLLYDGSAKEAAFSVGEAEAWEDAMGSLPDIIYTADRGSALTGGKAVNAGSYTASITVSGERASIRFSIGKVEYTGVTKTASGELDAAKGSTVTITLPAIPQGASYGRPARPGRYDPYTLSDISGSRITVTSKGIPAGTDSISFTVPVLPDGNHNGYNITVTVKIASSEINVTVRMDRHYIWTLLGRVPVYTATISASSPDTRITRIEHSLTGALYTPGNQITSLLPISQFYIRVTDSSGTRYNYVYRNGQVIRR